MGFSENYLALRKKRKEQTETGTSKGKPSGRTTFTDRYLTLREQGENGLTGLSLPTLTETRTVEPPAQTAYRPPQTMSEAIADQWRARAAEEKAAADAAADVQNRSPAWAREMADRYKPKGETKRTGSTSRVIPPAAERLPGHSDSGGATDWRGIPLEQSPDGVRSQSFAREEPRALDRIQDTVSGAAKSYGASLANAQANLYDLSQGTRDAMNRELLEAAQLKYGQAKRDYDETKALAEKYPDDIRRQKDLEASRNMLEAARRELEAYGMVPEVQRKAAEQSYRVSDQLAESGQADVERAKAGLNGLGRFAVDVGAGGLQLGADIAGGMATGGGTMLPLLLRSYGGGAQEARQEGASAGQAAAYGAASALTEVLTEKISSLGNIQTKAFGSGALDDILEGAVGAVERIGKTEAGRKLLNRAASAGVGFLSEGAEEFVSGVVSPLLKKGIYAQGPIDWKSVMEDAAYEFLVGGGIGAISGGLGGTNTRDIQSQYLTGVTDRAQNDAYRAMAEKGMFSQEAMKTARDALGKIDKAWERTGTELPGLRLPELEDLRTGQETAADGEESGGDTGTPPQAQTGLESKENGVTGPVIQEEAQKNTDSGKETIGENGLVELSEHEQANLSSGKKNKVISTFQEAAAFIRNALTDRQNVDRAYLGKIPDEVARRTYAETGVDIQGYTAILPSEAVRHIFKNHGSEQTEAPRGQVPVTERSAALISTVLSKPDRVYLSEKLDARGRTTLVFEKDIGNYFITAQAVTEGKKALTTDTLYIKKKNSQGAEFNAGVSASPEQNVQNDLPQSSSTSTIPQAAPAVNSRPAWGFVESGSRAELSKADRKMLDDLGKITRSEIRTVTQEELDRLAGKAGADGVQLGDRIYISETADRPVLEVAKHELTHRLQETAPEAYGAFRDYVAEVYRADGSLDGYIQGIRERWAQAGLELTEEEALDEIAADYAGDLLVDEGAVRRLAGDDPGLLERMLDGLREIIARIRRAFTGQADAQAEELERAARLWEDALRSAGENAEPEGLQLLAADEEAKPRFSIAYDQDNRPFVTVEEDILEGVPREDWVRTVKDNLRKKFPGGVTVGNSEIKINAVSRNELTASRNTQKYQAKSPQIYADKMRATNNLDEILRASRDYVNEAPLHPRTDNFTDFGRGTVQMRVGGRDYTADVVVGYTTGGKMVMYDIVNMQESAISDKKTPGAEFADQPHKAGRSVDSSTPTQSAAPASGDSTLPHSTPDVKSMRTFPEEVMAQLTGEDPTSGGTPSETGSFGEEIMRQLTGRDSSKAGTGPAEIPGLSLPTLEDGGDADGGGNRYSMKGDAELKKEIDRLRRQNRRLKEKTEQTAELRKKNSQLKRSNSRWKEQTKRTDAPRRNQEAVAREARALLKEYSSTYDRAELADRLQTLWDHQADRYGGAPWVREKAPTKEEIRQEAKDIARDILENNEEQVNALHEEYGELRKELRTRGISIAPEYRADLESAGGYEGLRKQYFGRLRLSKDGTAVDQVYNDLADRYPELFPDDLFHPADQLTRLTDVLDALEPVFGNTYEREMDQAAEYLAGELLERFYDVEQKKLTFADKQAQKMAEARKKDREEFEARLYRKKRETETRIKRVQEKFKERDRKRIENQNAAQRRETIRRHADRLGRMLLRPTDKRHVPEELRGAALKFVQSLNLESGYSRDLFGNRVTAEQGEAQGAAPTMRSEAARALQEKLKKLAEDGGMTIDPDMDGYLDELAGMGDTPLSKLGKAELDTVWKVMQVLEHSIARSNELLGQSRYATVSEMAERLREENGGKKDRRNFAGLVGTVDQLVNMDMLTPETYFHKLGDAGEAIYKEMRSAADRQTGILKEGVEKAQKLTEESGVDLRKAEKELHTFSTSGGDLTLSTAQIMELYALSKRDQAMEHIYVGGLKPTGARKGAEAVGKAAPVKVTPSDVADIIGTLTAEQKKLADGLQGYLSGELSRHGNDASMAVYGYEKFKEKNYWPIKVDRNQTKSDVRKEAESRTVAGYGMTKAVKPQARNAVVLRGILDSYTDHLNQMATYSGWLAASEDVNRVHNYVFQDGDGGADGTVKTLLEQVYGRGGNSYLDKLMADIAMGTKAGAEPSPMDRGLNQFKAAKVGGNLRVIFQQPTAIIRAANMLDPKYFLTAKNPMKGWETAKKYSPIAQWKDWGYFELDTGRSLKELIAGTGGMVDKVKNVAMMPAGWADSVAWGHLWNAVEAETAEKHPELRRGGEEFYRKAAERFGEIIDRTQVVDSVLHRTQVMRSANSLTRMSTSFMSEPSKIFNMVYRDLFDLQQAKSGEARKKAGKALARSTTALIVSFAVNAVAQSLPDAWRGKDRDKSFWEKLTDAYVSNFLENFDPVGYVPFMKDFESIIQGYSVDRADLEGFSDVVNALGQMGKAIMGESKQSEAAAALELACKAGDLLGLPVSNIKRDVAGIIQTAIQGAGKVEAQYTMDKLGLNPDKASATFYDDLYRAMGKDWDQYESIYKDMELRGWDKEKLAENMERRMAEEAGLEKTSSLPVEYSTPGENLTFDQEIMRQLTGGKTWMDSLPEGTLDLARDLEELEPEDGADSVTRMQKIRELRDSIWGDEVKDLTLHNLLGEKDYDRMRQARKAGISIEKWCEVYEDIADQKIRRTGKSGSPSQEDVSAALKKSGLTEKQKDAIWAGYGWKGERVG